MTSRNFTVSITAVVALTLGGLLTVVYIFAQDGTDNERLSIFIGSVIAFIAPTIAAILAVIRANEAKLAGEVAASKSEKAADLSEKAASTVNEKINKLELSINGRLTQLIAKAQQEGILAGIIAEKESTHPDTTSKLIEGAHKTRKTITD